MRQARRHGPRQGLTRGAHRHFQVGLDYGGNFRQILVSLISFTPPLMVAVPVGSWLHPVPFFGPLLSLRMAGLMSCFSARLIPFRTAGLMFGLERETFQANTYTNPANSREDEINAEEKPENIEA